MRFKDFLTELDNPELKAIHDKNIAAKMAARYDGKPIKIEREVRLAKDGSKIVKREFTVDNDLKVLRALNTSVRIVDLGDREYAIDDPKHSNSIPYRVHGLPARTRRKSGFAPEDLRREVYAA